jgi:hypothetical protein
MQLHGLVRIGNLINIDRYFGDIALVISIQESYATLVVLTEGHIRMIRFEDIGYVIQ